MPDGGLLSHLLGPDIVAHLNHRVSEAQEKLLLLRSVHLPLRLRLRLLFLLVLVIGKLRLHHTGGLGLLGVQLHHLICGERGLLGQNSLVVTQVHIHRDHAFIGGSDLLGGGKLGGDRLGSQLEL